MKSDKELEKEIEKILLNYDKYILTDKEGKLIISSLNKCVKMDLQKAIELGRKEGREQSEEEIRELAERGLSLATEKDVIIKDLKQQLAEKEKATSDNLEMIEDLRKELLEDEDIEMVYIGNITEDGREEMKGDIENSIKELKQKIQGVGK